MLEDPLRLLLSVVLQSAILAVVTIGLFWAGIFVARRFGGSGAGYSLAPLGFVRPRSGVFLGVVTGVLVGLGLFLMSVIVGFLSVLVLEKFGYSADNTAQEPLMSGLRDWVGENPGAAIPAAFLVVAVIGPAVEELVFRGAIFGGLLRLAERLLRRKDGDKSGSGARWTAFVGAAVLSSALFATLHISAVIIPAIFILSVTLCALYWKTGSLLPNFIAHATFNSIVVLAIVLSGLL